MENRDAVKTAKVSLLWKILEKFGSQISQMIVSIILARLLTPEDYGSVALLTIFIQLAMVFVQAGLSSALIQKQDSDEEDESSVLVYSIVAAGLLYVVLYVCSEPLARFYGAPEFVSLMRVLSIVLFPGAFSSLYVAILSKRFDFKSQFYCTFISVCLSGGIGIMLAFGGFGAWALVAQQLSNQVILAVSLGFAAAWKPNLSFSFSKTKRLLSFGSRLLFANFIDKLYHNLESLIIGAKFSPATLAFCDKGKMFPIILIDNVDGSIQSVMFPLYSNKQSDRDELKRLLTRSLSMSTYLVFPLMLCLASVAVPTITIILGEQWMGAVPYMRLYCLIAMLFPFQTVSLQAINSIGRSDIYFKLIAIKRSVGLFFLLIAAVFFKTPIAIVCSALFAEVAGVFFNLVPLFRLFNYSLHELVKEIAPNAAISLIVLTASVCAGSFISSYFLQLVAQLFVATGFFFAFSSLTGNINYLSIRHSICQLIRFRNKGVNE